MSLFFFRLITGLYWWINVIYYILLIIKLILFKKPACLKVCSHLAHIYRLRRRSRGIIITRIQAFTGIVYNPPFTMVLNFVPLNEGSNSKVAYNHQLYTLKNIVDLSQLKARMHKLGNQLQVWSLAAFWRQRWRQKACEVHICNQSHNFGKQAFSYVCQNSS